MRWAGNVACMGERRGAYRVLVGKHGGRISRYRWENKIKKWDIEARTRLIWLRICTGGRLL